MTFVDIHLEGCDDNGKRIEQMAKLGKPFSLSIVPVLMNPDHEVFNSGVLSS